MNEAPGLLRGHDATAGWPADWLVPSFSAANVRAVMTARSGGFSGPPFDSFNLRFGIGDDEERVAANRGRLVSRLGVPTRRIDQVHGAAVCHLQADVEPEVLPMADAAVTSESGLACEIQVADCLPVLFADRCGRAVGAAHAGWRGLAAGVLEATLDAVARLAGVAPVEIEAWLGPCIGPSQFEVGIDVLQAFGVGSANVGDRTAAARHFQARPGPDDGVSTGKWTADLAGLARDRLQLAGVGRLSGNDGGAAWCTVSRPERYFSFRRDRTTGRMAALIWLTH